MLDPHSLNKAQSEAVNHPGGPLLMAAGAGSGKTKALTYRLKGLINRGVRPEEIIAITFTNKAADQMRQRVLGKESSRPSTNFPTKGVPFLGTFHSLGYRILKRELPLTGRRPGFSIVDADDSLALVKRILKSMNVEKDRVKPIPLANAISDIKSELKNPPLPEESEEERDQLLGEVFRRYEEELQRNNAFDFDDLIEKVVRLFQQHPEVLKLYQTMFSHILVDEYQDINTAQYQLVRLLAQSHQNISVVGDDAQAIYSFRGADFRNFLNFTRDWPNAKMIKLEQNYRSTKNIIAGAGAVIAHNERQTPKELWTNNEKGELISLVAAEDPDTESIWIANEIRAIREHNAHASIGILYRTNAQSRPVEQALISENLPYTIFGGLKFYERKEVKDVVAFLKLALNPADTLSAERLEKSLGKRSGSLIITGLKGLPDNTSALELINFFMTEGHYQELLIDKFGNPQERMENIAELINFATQFSSLEDFLERVALLQANDKPSSEVVSSRDLPVTLMTIHIAKGLEFDYVFVVGCNEGTLPHQKSMARQEEIEEERRLMYVAMTRARKKLYLSFHAFPSRFLYEIPNELFEFISPTGNIHGLPSEDDMYIEQ